jgi:predicted ATPase
MQPILERAFPGSTFHFMENSFFMKVLGVNRPMGPKELSDGTLKFLALAAACFAKRPEPLVAFNEPENSLSPAAIEPLADMFAHAAQYSQLWVTTHSEELAQAMVNRTACRPIHLEKLDGETTLKGRSMKHGYQSEE